MRILLEIIKIDKEINNPNDESYYDSFNDQNILVIILYLGNYDYIDNEGKTQITDKFTAPGIFDEMIEKYLKKKGFKYKKIYSNWDAINELARDEDGSFIVKKIVISNLCKESRRRKK